MTAHRQHHRQHRTHNGGGGGANHTPGRSGSGSGGGPGKSGHQPPGRSGGPNRQRTRRTRHPKRSAAGLVIHGDWVTGFNDEAPTCMATAIANSLLAVTGKYVTGDDVMRFFEQSGGDRRGLSMSVCMAALATHGIGGHRPAGRCCPVTGALELGDIVGLAGTHAAVFTGEGLVSWGTIIPPEDLDGEAWRVVWTA